MFVSWGVLVPAGVLSARYLKALQDGLWFKLHKAFMMLAMLLMAIGLIVVVRVVHVFSEKRRRP